MYDLRVTVDEVKGFCDLPMKEGDYFEVQGGKIIIPDGKYICFWALQSLMPAFPAKQRETNEENDWIPNTTRFCCPDPNGMVIYRIERIDPLTGQVTASNKETKVPPARMLVNEEVCSGCRACETICSFQHSGSFNGSINSRIKVEKLELTGKDIPRVCRQCGNAPCVKACPTGALYRDKKTKAILVNQGVCSGCGICATACPFEVITFDQEKEFPLICDLCEGEVLCVQRCPVKAIEYGNAEKKSK